MAGAVMVASFLSSVVVVVSIGKDHEQRSTSLLTSLPPACRCIVATD